MAAPCTKGPVISQYIADQFRPHGLVPAARPGWERLGDGNGSPSSAELLGLFAAVPAPPPADYKPMVTERLVQRLTWVNGELAGGTPDPAAPSPWPMPVRRRLTGRRFVGIDISGLAHLVAFSAPSGGPPPACKHHEGRGLAEVNVRHLRVAVTIYSPTLVFALKLLVLLPLAGLAGAVALFGLWSGLCAVCQPPGPSLKPFAAGHQPVPAAVG